MWLLILLLLAVVFIIIATTKLKLHPFLALLIAAFEYGIKFYESYHCNRLVQRHSHSLRGL